MVEDRVKVFDFPLECHTAYYFAKCKHDEVYQTRKVTGVPYFVHPKGVALMVMKNGGNNDQIRAALLHDTLEDTHTSDEELRVCFGEHVQSLVRELTNQRYKIEEMGKEAYMTEKLMRLSNEALLIKLSDMLYNIQDHPTEAQEVRMLHNVAGLIENRKDLTDNTRRLAMMVFGS
jgi:(p)ppGpp synthase/HD superfamily hydrolase